MKVSVIMGIYNCAPTLAEALDSLLAQTYQGFKVIMCDDGSTDNTYKIAKSYSDKYENFILIRNERNMGLNVTLNHCLEYADTEYCARMDGDDISLPTRFEKEVNFLDKHPEFAIVSCPMIYFDEEGEFMRDNRQEHEPSKKDFNYGTPFCHAPSMTRTSVYKEVGGYTVDPKLLRIEDYNLFMKIYAIGHKGYMLGECLYAMRDDRNAVSRRTLTARLHGVYAHWIAYKELNLNFILFLRYSAIVIFLGIIPSSLYTALRNIKHIKMQTSKKRFGTLL